MTLDVGLLTLPKELGEFVIVHELVHLLVPNHGRVFKSFMHAYLPDWETREKQLQMHYEKDRRKVTMAQKDKRNTLEIFLDTARPTYSKAPLL